MAARSFTYHAHGTADGDKFCCYPWLVYHDIKLAMHCSLRLAPTMINHLTNLITITVNKLCLLATMFWLRTTATLSYRLAALYSTSQASTVHDFPVTVFFLLGVQLCTKKRKETLIWYTFTLLHPARAVGLFPHIVHWCTILRLQLLSNMAHFYYW